MGRVIYRVDRQHVSAEIYERTKAAAFEAVRDLAGYHGGASALLVCLNADYPQTVQVMHPSSRQEGTVGVLRELVRDGVLEVVPRHPRKDGRPVVVEYRLRGES